MSGQNKSLFIVDENSREREGARRDEFVFSRVLRCVNRKLSSAVQYEEQEEEARETHCAAAVFWAVGSIPSRLLCSRESSGNCADVD